MADPVPPALRYRLRDVMRLLPTDGGPLEGAAEQRLARLLVDGEPWLGADPALADTGYWMLEARHAPELRRRGCVWLTMFPTVETVKRLAAVALDSQTPAPVREQAIWSLGYRQARALHPSTRWSDDAISLADDALAKLATDATAAGKITGERLPQALRHVSSDGAAAVFARAPGLWGEALECFATPPLARVLLVCIDDIPAQHRLRVLRLVGATLGEEAVPMLLARANAASISERLEMLFLAIALGGEQHVGRLEDALRGMQQVDMLRARAKWHASHRGVVPTVHGLRVARATAVLPPAERMRWCAQAADDLGALAKFERYPEAYLYAMWGWMVRGSGDPARARELVSAHPESQQLVRDLYLVDLARRGRVKQLTAAAQTLQGAEAGALALAIWGRPFAALELAATARVHSPELVCARALACYRAGRPDLSARILAEDLPPSEIVDDDALPPFPGPHEQWLVANGAIVGGVGVGGAGAGDAGIAAHVAAVKALAGGLDGVIALARPAPHDAEPDTPSLEPLAAVVRRLGRGFPGSTVYLAGEFARIDRGKVTAAVERLGARLVAGPFPGTDYYVHGDYCLVQTIAQLERQGARRARELEDEGR